MSLVHIWGMLQQIKASGRVGSTKAPLAGMPSTAEKRVTRRHKGECAVSRKVVVYFCMVVSNRENNQM